MSSSIPPNPFAWLVNDVDTAEDLDDVVPAEPVLLGRILDGWEVLTLEEYAAARPEKDAA